MSILSDMGIGQTSGLPVSDKQKLIQITNDAEANQNDIKSYIISAVNNKANTNLTDNSSWNDIGNAINNIIMGADLKNVCIQNYNLTPYFERVKGIGWTYNNDKKTEEVYVNTLGDMSIYFYDDSNSIYKLDNDGKFIWKISLTEQIECLAIDKYGSVYATTNTNSILKYDSTGKLLSRFSYHGKVIYDNNFDCLFIASTDGYIYKTDLMGNQLLKSDKTYIINSVYKNTTIKTISTGEIFILNKNFSGTLIKLNIDGTFNRNINTSVGFDILNNKIYWINMSDSNYGYCSIYRSDINGTSEYSNNFNFKGYSNSIRLLNFKMINEKKFMISINNSYNNISLHFGDISKPDTDGYIFQISDKELFNGNCLDSDGKFLYYSSNNSITKSEYLDMLDIKDFEEKNIAYDNSDNSLYAVDDIYFRKINLNDFSELWKVTLPVHDKYTNANYKYPIIHINNDKSICLYRIANTSPNTIIFNKYDNNGTLLKDIELETTSSSLTSNTYRLSSYDFDSDDNLIIVDNGGILYKFSTDGILISKLNFDSGYVQVRLDIDNNIYLSNSTFIKKYDKNNNLLYTATGLQNIISYIPYNNELFVISKDNNNYLYIYRINSSGTTTFSKSINIRNVNAFSPSIKPIIDESGKIYFSLNHIGSSYSILNGLSVVFDTVTNNITDFYNFSIIGAIKDINNDFYFLLDQQDDTKKKLIKMSGLQNQNDYEVFKGYGITADNTQKIYMAQGNAKEEDVRSGKTFTNADGYLRTGNATI